MCSQFLSAIQCSFYLSRMLILLDGISLKVAIIMPDYNHILLTEQVKVLVNILLAIGVCVCVCVCARARARVRACVRVCVQVQVKESEPYIIFHRHGCSDFVRSNKNDRNQICLVSIKQLQQMDWRQH